MSLNVIEETQEETERLEDELKGKSGPIECCGSGCYGVPIEESVWNCHTAEGCDCSEPPMTHAEIVAVAAHMSFNVSTLLRDIDNNLSDQALSLAEKLLSRYEEKKAGLHETDIEELKKRILGLA